MIDNPTLFTEVLSRAEVRRAALVAAIEQHQQEADRHELLRREALAALEAAQRELATLEHIIEPLAADAVAWCNTEKAQPWARPEQHRRVRRTLQELVFSAVAKHPGQLPEFLAETLTKLRRRQTDPALVKTILHAHPDKVEWRDGWYPVGDQGSQLDIYRCDLCGAEQSGAVPAFCRRDGCYQPHRASGVMRLAKENPGREKATGRAGGDEQETGHCPVSVLPPAARSDDELARDDPDLCEHGWSPLHPQPCPECGEDIAALSEARTEPSAGHPIDNASNTDGALQARSPSPVDPSPEVTLDYIRRAGADGLGDFQLRNHVDNLSVLEQRGAIERGEDGRWRHVVAGAEVDGGEIR